MEPYQNIFSYIYESLLQDLNSYQTGEIGELVKENFNLSKERIQAINLDLVTSEVSFQHKPQALMLYYSLAFVIISESNTFTIKDASRCLECLIFISQNTNIINLQESVEILIFSINSSAKNSNKTVDFINWILKLREIASFFQFYNNENDEKWIIFKISSNLLVLLRERSKDSIIKGLKELAKLKKCGIRIGNQENNFASVSCDWIEETNDYFGLKDFVGEEINSDIEGAQNMLGYLKDFDIQGEIKAKVTDFIAKYNYISPENEEFNEFSLIKSWKYIEIIGEPIYAWSRGPLYTVIQKGILRLPGLKEINVAIKSTSHPDKAKLKGSESEAYYLKKLSGKHSALPIFYGDFYDKNGQNNRYNIVMELLNRETLCDDIFERKKSLKYYTDQEYSKMLVALLDCIAFLHSQQIFHRDLKPQNVLFNEVGDIKIVDFNVAEAMEMQTIDVTSREESIAGTENYMSPEIREALNNKRQGIDRKPETKLSKSDMYSLGLILLEMRTLGDINNVNLKNNESRSKLRRLINEIIPLEGMNLKELIENMLKENFKERIGSKTALSFINGGVTEMAI